MFSEELQQKQSLEIDWNSIYLSVLGAGPRRSFMLLGFGV